MSSGNELLFGKKHKEEMDADFKVHTARALKQVRKLKLLLELVEKGYEVAGTINIATERGLTDLTSAFGGFQIVTGALFRSWNSFFSDGGFDHAECLYELPFAMENLPTQAEYEAQQLANNNETPPTEG